VNAVRRLALGADQNGRVRLLRRFLGAIALGVGAIFGHKGEHETHWSEPPNWIADTETDEADSGDP
jgi:hypothetical protein